MTKPGSVVRDPGSGLTPKYPWTMAAKADREVLTVAGQEISISNPNKVLFPQAGHTKLDLVRYYLAVADGALRGAGGRPTVLVRYPNGIDGEYFYQKRAPQSRPSCGLRRQARVSSIRDAIRRQRDFDDGNKC